MHPRPSPFVLLLGVAAQACSSGNSAGSAGAKGGAGGNKIGNGGRSGGSVDTGSVTHNVLTGNAAPQIVVNGTNFTTSDNQEQ